MIVPPGFGKIISMNANAVVVVLVAVPVPVDLYNGAWVPRIGTTFMYCVGRDGKPERPGALLRLSRSKSFGCECTWQTQDFPFVPWSVQLLSCFVV